TARQRRTGGAAGGCRAEQGKQQGCRQAGMLAAWVARTHVADRAVFLTLEPIPRAHTGSRLSHPARKTFVSLLSAQVVEVTIICENVRWFVTWRVLKFIAHYLHGAKTVRNENSVLANPLPQHSGARDTASRAFHGDLVTVANIDACGGVGVDLHKAHTVHLFTHMRPLRHARKVNDAGAANNSHERKLP